MSHELFELISQALRYVLVLLMLLIVLRALKGMLVDSRRSAVLRHLIPLTGQCGELLVREGSERARPGMRYPIIREGSIGSAGRSDVRIRHRSVRRRHAYFQLTEQGLFVRSHAGARLRDGVGRPVHSLLLEDNDTIYIGGIRLQLILNMPDGTVISTTGHGRHDVDRLEHRSAHDEDELFDTGHADGRVPLRSDEPPTAPHKKKKRRPSTDDEYEPPIEEAWQSHLSRERSRAEAPAHRVRDRADAPKHRVRDLGWDADDEELKNLDDLFGDDL